MSRRLLIAMLLVLLPATASCQYLLWRIEGDSGVPEPPPPPPPASGYFYVDPAAGSDAADGNSVSVPWQTLSYAIANADAASVIYLLDGDYGDMTLDGVSTAQTSSWNDLITITPYSTGAAFQRLRVTNMPSAYLRFDGITVHVPDGNGGTHTVMIDDSSHIRVTDSVLDGDYTGALAAELTQHGVSIWGDTATVSYVTIEDCNIVENRYPVYIRGAVRDGVVVTDCDVHWASASFVSVNTDGGHGQIELSYNRLYDRDARPGEHGSGFSCRSNKLTIRGNVITDFGGSGGIRFYTDVPDVYSDMIVENNLIYGMPHSTLMFCRQMGSNCLIRNNTCLSLWRSDPPPTSTARYIGGSSFDVAAGGPYSNIRMYGNIFMGINTFAYSFADYVTEDYNLYWCLKDNDVYFDDPLGANSYVVIDSSGYNGSFYPTYFESNGVFFTGMSTPAAYILADEAWVAVSAAVDIASISQTNPAVITLDTWPTDGLGGDLDDDDYVRITGVTGLSGMMFMVTAADSVARTFQPAIPYIDGEGGIGTIDVDGTSLDPYISGGTLEWVQPDFSATFFEYGAAPGYDASYLTALTPATGTLGIGGANPSNAPSLDLTQATRDAAPDLGALENLP